VKTHYKVLSMKEGASYEEIGTSYRSVILNSHPREIIEGGPLTVPLSTF
jgi:DnaJ-class molecular chaperone